MFLLLHLSCMLGKNCQTEAKKQPFWLWPVYTSIPQNNYVWNSIVVDNNPSNEAIQSFKKKKKLNGYHISLQVTDAAVWHRSQVSVFNSFSLRIQLTAAIIAVQLTKFMLNGSHISLRAMDATVKYSSQLPFNIYIGSFSGCIR